MEPGMQRSMRDLVPLKSSWSVILCDTQVWSDTVCTNGEDVDLGVFAQRLVEQRSTKYEIVREQEKRAKKSRQVFTFSQPTGGTQADFAGDDAEVYESTGQEMGSLCGMEPHMRDLARKQVDKRQAPALTAPIPDGSHIALPRNSIRQEVAHSEISYSKFVVPRQASSECGLKACLPCTDKPSLFYSVSDSSLPILKNSSRFFNKVSSQAQFFEGLQNSFYIPYGHFSCAWFGGSKLGRAYSPTRRRSILINHHKDVLVEYTKMDDDLARKIATAIQQVKAERGKFMSYAKFNSSFKLSEVFYEGINSRTVSHVPSLTRPFHLSGLIHKVNPDYDENESLTEALTVIKSLSSITSLSRITRVCHLVSSKDLNGRNRVDCGWIKSNLSSCETSSKLFEYVVYYEFYFEGWRGNQWKKAEMFAKSYNAEHPLITVTVSGFGALIRPVEASNNSTGSLSHVLTVRKGQVFTLRDQLRTKYLRSQKETDLWSSASTGPKAVTPSPKRLVDVISPSCIFRASLVEAMKRPVWQLKTPERAWQDRTDRVNDFIFKAHNYMHVRDRPNSHKCFFQPQPSYRVVDESVQFPDVAIAWDRSSSIKKPQSENRISQSNQDQSKPEDNSIFQESSNTTLPMGCLSPQASPDYVEPNPPKDTNLNGVVACDKPTYSTSEFQTVSSNPAGPVIATTNKSSFNLPSSTSSNRCQSSSLYLTSSTAPSQPKVKKTIKPKLEPVIEDGPKPCKAPRTSSTKQNQFCRSYPAFCDKRKIRIKYDNGRYTVLKETDRPKRQTIWSILTGKATHLLKSVVPRRHHVHRRPPVGR